MSFPRFQPSTRPRLHVLCNVLAGCSFGGIVLIAEERRRRIALAQKIIENGRILQKYKTYQTAAPITAFELGEDWEPPASLRTDSSDRHGANLVFERSHSQDHGESSQLSNWEWRHRRRKHKRLPIADTADYIPPSPTTTSISPSVPWHAWSMPMPLEDWNTRIMLRPAPPPPQAWSASSEPARIETTEQERSPVGDIEYDSGDLTNPSTVLEELATPSLPAENFHESHTPIRSIDIVRRQHQQRVQGLVARRVRACLDDGSNLGKENAWRELSGYLSTHHDAPGSDLQSVAKSIYDLDVAPASIREQAQRCFESMTSTLATTDTTSPILTEEHISADDLAKTLETRLNKSQLSEAYEVLVLAAGSIADGVSRNLQLAIDRLAASFMRAESFVIVNDIVLTSSSALKEYEISSTTFWWLLQNELASRAETLAKSLLQLLPSDSQTVKLSVVDWFYEHSGLETATNVFCASFDDKAGQEPGALAKALWLCKKAIDADSSSLVESLLTWFEFTKADMVGGNRHKSRTLIPKLINSSQIQRFAQVVVNVERVGKTNWFPFKQHHFSMLINGCIKSDLRMEVAELIDCIPATLPLVREESIEKASEAFGDAFRDLLKNRTPNPYCNGKPLLYCLEAIKAGDFSTLRATLATSMSDFGWSNLPTEILTYMSTSPEEDLAGPAFRALLATSSDSLTAVTIVDVVEHLQLDLGRVLQTLGDDAEHTALTIYKAYAKAGPPDAAVRVLEAIQPFSFSRFVSDIRIANSDLIQRVWDRTQNLSMTRSVFDRICNTASASHATTIPFYRILEACIASGNFDLADVYMSRMVKTTDVTESVYVIGQVVLSKAMQRDWEGVESLLARMHKADLIQRRHQERGASFNRTFVEYCNQHTAMESLAFLQHLVSDYGFQVSKAMKREMAEKIVRHEDDIALRGWINYLKTTDDTFIISADAVVRLMRRMGRDVYDKSIHDLCRSVEADNDISLESARALEVFGGCLTVDETSPGNTVVQQPNEVLQMDEAGERSREVERKMLASLARGRPEEAIAVYERSLIRGLPRKPLDLDLAVSACLQLGPDSRQKADSLIETAQARGMDVSRARRRLMVHDISMRPSLSFTEARAIVYEQYEHAEKTGAALNHHMTLAAATKLTEYKHPDLALRLMLDVLQSSWAEKKPFDIACYTLLFRLFHQKQDFEGVHWLIEQVLLQNLPLDKQFSQTVYQALRSTRKFKAKVEKSSDMHQKLDTLLQELEVGYAQLVERRKAQRESRERFAGLLLQARR